MNMPLDSPNMICFLCFVVIYGLAPLRNTGNSLKDASDLFLSRSLEVKSIGAIGPPMYGFLFISK